MKLRFEEEGMRERRQVKEEGEKGEGVMWTRPGVKCRGGEGSNRGEGSGEQGWSIKTRGEDEDREEEKKIRTRGGGGGERARDEAIERNEEHKKKLKEEKDRRGIQVGGGQRGEGGREKVMETGREDEERMKIKRSVSKQERQQTQRSGGRKC